MIPTKLRWHEKTIKAQEETRYTRGEVRTADKHYIFV